MGLHAKRSKRSCNRLGDDGDLVHGRNKVYMVDFRGGKRVELKRKCRRPILSGLFCFV